MKRLVLTFCCLSLLIAVSASAQTLQSDFAPLIEASCLSCHDAETETRLNFETLKHNLAEPNTFRHWEGIYDRLSRGEMPPASEPQLDSKMLATLLTSLKDRLRTANLNTRRKYGRVPARRLTRSEFDYTIRDLLLIDGDVSEVLPPDSTAGSFDTIGSAQHISAMHLEGYLTAADRALNAAIKLHASPYRSYEFDLLNNKHLNSFHKKELRLGGNISRKLDDGVAVFRDVDYLLRSDLHGFKVRSAGSGRYRIHVTAESFQSQDPVALKVVVKDVNGQTDLIGVCDLMPGKTHTIEVEPYLSRTKVFYVAMAEERPPALILGDILDAGGATKYQGQGIAVKSIRVEGPITGGWPPKSTRELLSGLTFAADADDGLYDVELTKPALSHVRDVVAQFAPRAFRRPLIEGELNALVALAEPAIAQERDFVDVIRIPLRAIFSSPHFVLFAGKPGPLDDFALASRLSYFLWKSMPDAELLKVAEQGTLSEPDALAQQVERMMKDDRFDRFLLDFSGQWLRLNELEATSPDEKLYPEYDEILHWSVPRETAFFLRELVKEDLSISNLIDSEFTFLNRRLANHYGIDDVVGQQLRKVELPAGSPRGGVLTQASILKVTANGLVTSPVRRGDFVLTDLLGTPPPPPPANVGSIEPDTSGATTVREQLHRHRAVESCAKCHRLIDPPGFALESFDPIGGFRTQYRVAFDDLFAFVSYADGPEVDSRGVTADGKEFDGIEEFRRHLMSEKDQLARHFISQLVAYATGGEIEFADREEIDAIFDRTRKADFPVRTIINEVVQSKLFRHR